MFGFTSRGTRRLRCKSGGLCRHPVSPPAQRYLRVSSSASQRVETAFGQSGAKEIRLRGRGCCRGRGARGRSFFRSELGAFEIAKAMVLNGTAREATGRNAAGNQAVPSLV